MRGHLIGLKLHFIFSFAMFIFIALMVIQKDQTIRALLLVPTISSFLAYQIFYGLELSSIVSRKIKEMKQSEVNATKI